MRPSTKNNSSLSKIPHVLHPSTTKQVRDVQQAFFPNQLKASPLQAHHPSSITTVPPHRLVPNDIGQMVPQVPKHVDRITAAVTRNLNRVNEGYNANEAMMSKFKSPTTGQSQGHSSPHTQKKQQPQDKVELTESTAGREPDAEVKPNHEQQDNSNLTENALPIITHSTIDHETSHSIDKPRQHPVLHHGHSHNTESAVNHVLETDTRMPQPISTRSQPQEPPTRATSDITMSIGPQDPEAWLTQDMEQFFPTVITPPAFDQTPRPKLCRLLVGVSKMTEPTPAKDKFRYERTPPSTTPRSSNDTDATWNTASSP